MLTTLRNATLAVAVVFGVWEAIDIPDTGLIAAVFAVVFFACVVWLRRSGNRIAAIVLLLQFAVEATQAHTWQDASASAKDAAMVLGTAGIVAAAGFLACSLRPRRLLGRSTP